MPEIDGGTRGRMEALMATYGDASSDSDTDAHPPATIVKSAGKSVSQAAPITLPPPPLSLLTPPNTVSSPNYCARPAQPNRVRSFPHVEGNYALHVYIPVQIPPAARKEVARFLNTASSLIPGLHVVDADVPLDSLSEDDQKLEKVAVGREFHISLGRTVPIRVHQIDSVVSMLRQKLQSQKRYWIDFSKWEVFVNDDRTRTFLSIEVVTGGLAEITKQIRSVDEVYKLHNLPEFYKDPRPHISLAWALGDVSDLLKRVVEAELKRFSAAGSVYRRIFACKFGSIECKIGIKTYKICKFADE